MINLAPLHLSLASFPYTLPMPSSLARQAIEVMSGALVLLPPDDPALLTSLVRPPGGETGLAYTAYETAGADRVSRVRQSNRHDTHRACLLIFHVYCSKQTPTVHNPSQSRI